MAALTFLVLLSLSLAFGIDATFIKYEAMLVAKDQWYAVETVSGKR